MGNYAEGANASQGQDMNPAEEKAHHEALTRFHAGLEKLHMAEAELARVRADLARSGVDLTVKDSLHW